MTVSLLDSTFCKSNWLQLDKFTNLLPVRITLVNLIHETLTNSSKQMLEENIKIVIRP